MASLRWNDGLMLQHLILQRAWWGGDSQGSLFSLSSILDEQWQLWGEAKGWKQSWVREAAA